MLLQRNSGELNAALAADALELAATNPMAGWGGRAEHITGSQIGSFFTSRAAKLKSVQATVSKHEGTSEFCRRWGATWCRTIPSCASCAHFLCAHALIRCR